jgi:hypothetical protein
VGCAMFSLPRVLELLVAHSWGCCTGLKAALWTLCQWNEMLARVSNELLFTIDSDLIIVLCLFFCLISFNNNFFSVTKFNILGLVSISVVKVEFENCTDGDNNTKNDVSLYFII